MAYSLATSYMGESLLSGFNWFNGADPTHGFVSYQTRDNAEAMDLFKLDPVTGSVRLGVDHTNIYGTDEGRPSIRLESKESYTHGLFIADFTHMPPSQCGLWPAFWSYGPNWPHGGEIDIIEGANTAHQNLISAHTSSGCKISNELASQAVGIARTVDCDVGTANVGCGYAAPAADAATYGDGFNAVNGGVYAMQWDDQHIRVWHFPRSLIPADIKAKKPKPDSWGRPQAAFGSSSCDIDNYFKDMNIVINIDFCGDYGNGVWESDGCTAFAPTCAEWVGNNPAAFANAYWDISYIDAYVMGDAVDSEDSDSPLPSIMQSASAAASSPVSSRQSSAASTSSASSESAVGAAASTSAEASASTPTVSSVIALMNSTTAAAAAAAAPTPSDASPLYVAKIKSNNTTSQVVTNTTMPMLPLNATRPEVVVSHTSQSTPIAVPSVEATLPTNPTSLNDYGYLGCFGSNNGFQSFHKVGESGKMTLQQCIKMCNGIRYAGIFENACYCASAMDANTRAMNSKADCDVHCPGDNKQFCGGHVTSKNWQDSLWAAANVTQSDASPVSATVNSTVVPATASTNLTGAAADDATAAQVARRSMPWKQARRFRARALPKYFLTVYGSIAHEKPPQPAPPMAVGVGYQPPAAVVYPQVAAEQPSVVEAAAGAASWAPAPQPTAAPVVPAAPATYYGGVQGNGTGNVTIATVPSSTMTEYALYRQSDNTQTSAPAVPSKPASAASRNLSGGATFAMVVLSLALLL